MRAGMPVPENVTRQPPALGLSFTQAFTPSSILPGDGNYRYYLNADIIAMNMDGIALGEDPRSAAGPYARGNRR
jgi:hypothetical protein